MGNDRQMLIQIILKNTQRIKILEQAKTVNLLARSHFATGNTVRFVFCASFQTNSHCLVVL